MPNLDDLLHSAPPEQLGQLKDAPETQKIFAMLNKSTGGTLEQAADKAAKGDTTQLMAAIKHLMQDPEGAKLIQQMKSKLNQS